MTTGHDLRAARRTADLTLAAVARLGGISAGHLSRIEGGERPVTPATVSLYQRAIRQANDVSCSSTVDDVNRRDLLATVSAAVVAPRVGAAGTPDLDECAQWFAWQAWRSGSGGMHESVIPTDRLPGVAELLRRRHLVRGASGFVRFPHPGLVDFYLACRVFAGVAAGASARLEAGQTSHATDLVIREFVSGDPASAATLGRWMVEGHSAVLRVNAAGILAKVGDAALTDEVISALRTDRATRMLYLTAVASRVMGLPWDDAARVAAGAETSMPDDGLVALIDELRNPRDAAARWCSAILLHQLGVTDREPIRHAVADALRAERSAENLRTMAALLAGADPAQLRI